MTRLLRPLDALLVASLIAAGCATHAPTASTPRKTGATPAPVDVVNKLTATGGLVTLSGTVRIVSNNGSSVIGDNGGGLVSDNGGGIVSDNGGGIISDNGGGLIANNGGGVISNNTGNLISNNGGGLIANNGGGILGNNGSSYHTLALAKGPAEFALADAVITLSNADGSPVLDAKGKPISATSDATGAYQFSAPLPAHNLLLNIGVHTGGLLAGGTLTAMLPHQAATNWSQAIDTSTSLGAAYVLGQYVKGSQSTFDKLPATEAAKLETDLDRAKLLLAGAPSYQPAALAALTTQLRGRAPAVSRELDDIKDLLLGQPNLGNGRPATQVPLLTPIAVALDQTGDLFVAEQTLGRIRSIAPDGLLTTYADVSFGQIKHNFTRTYAMVRSADGTFYMRTAVELDRMTPDGTVTNLVNLPDQVLTGSLSANAATAGATVTSTGVPTFTPGGMAVTPDGTLYTGIAESELAADFSHPCQLAVAKPGQPISVVPQPALGLGVVTGVVAEPDGTLDVTVDDGKTLTATLYHLVLNGAATKIATGLPPDFRMEMSRAPDGTIYMTALSKASVIAVKPDGSLRTVVGPGAPAPADGFSTMGQTTVDVDGTLYVPDDTASLVRALSPDGHWRVAAGFSGAVQTGDGTSLATNGPAGALFDAQNRLIISENGSCEVKRYDGTTYSTIAGSTAGYSGDGGPALQAKFGQLAGITGAGGALYVGDFGNGLMREIAADGTVSTVVGNGVRQGGSLTATDVIDARSYPLGDLMSVAMGLDGSIYMTDPAAHQVERLDPTHQHVTLLAGAPGAAGAGNTAAIAGILAAVATTSAHDIALGYPTGESVDAAGNLYLADTMGMTVYKISDPNGANPTIAPIAGVGLPQTLARSQTGVPAEEGIAAKDATLFGPAGVVVDAKGNIYIAEVGTVNLGRFPLPGADQSTSLIGQLGLPAVYPRIRKITPDGRITTLAGQGGKFFSDAAAEDALVLPGSLAIAPDGRMAIVDAGANLIHLLAAGSY